MNKTSRDFLIGDVAATDYNGPGTITRVQIIGRSNNHQSQSGICYQVTPLLKNCSPGAWIDADWFFREVTQ